MIGFWLKKAITALILPVPFACLIMLLGLLLLRRWRRAGQALLLAGPVYLLLLTLSPVSLWLAGPLESRYAPWQPQEPVSYVLVLGSSHHSDPTRHPLQQLSATALARLMEGIRVWRANPHATLVVSGYSGKDAVAHADLQRLAALSLGVPDEQIIVIREAKDTVEEARMTAAIIKQAPAVLVTSATHMHRSMLSYQAAGLAPVAAPTDFIATPTHPWYLTSKNLWTSQRAIHEYIGLFWLSLKKQ
ncbi:ElyC/SanA/YdcF family protein [Ferrimonas pelagia]|uniref:Envelope biogenesis factor ElyC n=1 Tax=Ferrimonas pelagia TaxID=1177826 RepID=A0ABP9EFB1_9GAMM